MFYGIIIVNQNIFSNSFPKTILVNNQEKTCIIEILSDSFDNNKSVNYIIKQDNKRRMRVKALMSYSVDICDMFGDVFLSEDRNACALIIYPDKVKTSLKSIWLDVKLAFTSLGIVNIMKAMKRESAIKKNHPAEQLAYLWFIGVRSYEQNNGAGTKLLQEIIIEAKKEDRTICLETSTERNIPWYHKHGFTIYKVLDFGYKLYCMKREPQ